MSDNLPQSFDPQNDNINNDKGFSRGYNWKFVDKLCLRYTLTSIVRMLRLFIIKKEEMTNTFYRLSEGLSRSLIYMCVGLDVKSTGFDFILPSSRKWNGCGCSKVWKYTYGDVRPSLPHSHVLIITCSIRTSGQTWCYQSPIVDSRMINDFRPNWLS